MSHFKPIEELDISELDNDYINSPSETKKELNNLIDSSLKNSQTKNIIPGNAYQSNNLQHTALTIEGHIENKKTKKEQSSPNSPGDKSMDVDHNSLLSNQKESLNSVKIREKQRKAMVALFVHHKFTIIAAVTILLLGIAFLVTSFYLIATNIGAVNAIIIFMVMSLVFGIPGAYQTIYIYKVFKGCPGYNFSNIPSFDG
jgi:hypothetical protein